MEAARGIKTVGMIADENERHPVQVSQWKKELLDSRTSSLKRTARMPGRKPRLPKETKPAWNEKSDSSP